MNRRAFLRLEWGLSLALIALALAWATWRGLPLVEQWRVTPRAVAAGTAAGAALWLWIPVLLALPAMRRVWDTILAPFARSLHTGDIVVIAVLSGVSEETFFRGVLLPELGLVASSALFGLLHALTPSYAAWAALTGAGFGLLALSAGTLVTPAVAHATYNLGALLILRRVPARVPAPQGGPSA
jgi:membrane protease YdiL (CAAX protease family)